jgi:cytochrome c oxidase assembly factor CtaG
VSGAYRFSFEPVFLVLGVAAAVLYVRAARRAPAEERPGAGRSLVFVLGVLLVAVPVDSPLETISAHYLLLAHLLQNALIADWGPPLLILGLTPAMRRGVAAAGGRPLLELTRPAVALVLWLAVWYGVHVPAFYDWALRLDWPLTVEHLLLVGAGLVFWWAVLGEPRRLDAPAALAYLGIAFVTAPWLSLAYVFASHPFYTFYADAPRLWGLSPTRDQNLAGILMNLEQTSIFFVAFALMLVRVLAEEDDAQRHLDAAYLEAHRL